MPAYCDNCTEIVVDGISRENTETICKRAGDDMTIEARFPKVFIDAAFAVRLNGQAGLLPANCQTSLSNLTCICSNLTAENDGNYTIHLLMDTTINVEGSSPYQLEWCSNNASVIVTSKSLSNIH